MKKSLLYYFSIEQQALILAVLIHIIIARVFIFSFPVKNSSHKPMFIFWGSFLDSINGSLISKKDAPVIKIAHPVYSKNTKFHEKTTAQKPHADYHDNKSNEKNFLKTSFLPDTSLALEMPVSDTSSYNDKKAEYIPLTTRPAIP